MEAGEEAVGLARRVVGVLELLGQDLQASLEGLAGVRPQPHGKPHRLRNAPAGASAISGRNASTNARVIEIAEAMAIAGLVWMVRIWRGPSGDAPRDWRSRE